MFHSSLYKTIFSFYDKCPFMLNITVPFLNFVNMCDNFFIDRVTDNGLDLFHENRYSTLKSISTVLERVCECKRHGEGIGGDIECNYGTYKSCKFVVGKQYQCILNPDGQLRRKRDIRHLQSIVSSTSNNYRSTFEVSKEFSIAISKKGDFCTPFHSLNCHMNAGKKVDMHVKLSK